MRLSAGKRQLLHGQQEPSAVSAVDAHVAEAVSILLNTAPLVVNDSSVAAQLLAASIGPPSVPVAAESHKQDRGSGSRDRV